MLHALCDNRFASCTAASDAGILHLAREQQESSDRVVRRYRALTAILSLLGLAACTHASTAPEPAAIRLRKEMMCVQYNANGEVISTQSPNADGGCTAGFDLKIWM
ncbi:MAG: hypothetical protein K2R93_19970 [Gemmatimonadaceae bacterium]|nr:hypothetical protein [Gemmatimonadaceae bacterium]